MENGHPGKGKWKLESVSESRRIPLDCPVERGLWKKDGSDGQRRTGKGRGKGQRETTREEQEETTSAPDALS